MHRRREVPPQRPGRAGDAYTAGRMRDTDERVMAVVLKPAAAQLACRVPLASRASAAPPLERTRRRKIVERAKAR